MSGTTVGVLAALLFYLHIAYADETTIYASSTIQQSNTVGVNNAQIAGPLISWEYVVNSSSKKYKNFFIYANLICFFFFFLDSKRQTRRRARNSSSANLARAAIAVRWF